MIRSVSSSSAVHVTTTKPRGIGPMAMKRSSVSEWGVIEDLEVIGARSEELFSLLEGDAVLAPVREVLGLIPRNPHLAKGIPGPGSRSMAYLGSHETAPRAEGARGLELQDALGL